MYVTRQRSIYRKHPGALTLKPQPEAVCSGHLVVSGEESDALSSCCFGAWRNDRIKRLPFPQDQILKVVHFSLHGDASVTKVWFVPVLDQPMSSNRYYVIKAKGRRKGEAYTCNREGDDGNCCFSRHREDPKTRPFDHRDIYQQFEISPYPGGGFFAKSIEWDGYPPMFLGKGGWEVYTVRSSKLNIQEVNGLYNSNSSPEPNNPLHAKRSNPIVLGNWYCPFVFVKEDNLGSEDQMGKSLLYELSLKQWWEQIHYTENEGNNRIVAVDARVKRRLCLVRGMEAEKDKDKRDGIDGFVWFKVKDQFKKRISVGLSLAVFEKMRWLQETRGWFDGPKEVRVSGNKEVKDDVVWRRFGCYVLVESFVLRRMDGGLLISFNFRNTGRIECRWE